MDEEEVEDWEADNDNDDYDDDYGECGTGDEMNEPRKLEVQTVEEATPIMDALNQEMGADVDYSILMREEDGSLTLHPRNGMPCYGELRKYVSTHGDAATQPEDRPGDLHFPFPEGTPVAVGVKFKNQREFIERMVSDDSPWRRGFGSSSGVFVSDKGAVFKNTEIDPTVLVNMLKVIQSRTYKVAAAKFIKGHFDFFEEVFIIDALTIYPAYEGHPIRVGTHMNTYTWNVNFSPALYMSGRSNDLTGGTLRDRFDYSRKYMQDIFKGEGFNFLAELSKTVTRHERGMPCFESIEHLVECLKKVWDIGMIEAIRTVWAECLASSNQEEVKVA